MVIENLYNIVNSKNICTDSRQIVNDSIFFALKGENFDGNKYANEAINNGCELAIIDNEKYKINEKYILVDNTLKVLQNLARYHRKKINIPIIAITGTNGKTTTKELISAALSKKFNVSSTLGNFNNHIGVPLTILRMNYKTEIGVIEMGANHAKEIETLCKISSPNYGLITNIGKAHIEGFGSFEGIINSKKELYTYISETGGTVFFNNDNKILLKLLKSYKINTISYGKNINANYIGKSLKSNPFLQLSWKEKNSKKGFENIKTCLVGNYNLENVLATIAVSSYFGVNCKDIKSAIEEYKPKLNRSQYLKTNNNELILDAYNANPSSMEVAIENFSKLNKDNKVLIIGDMLELGKISETEHIKIIKLIIKEGFTRVLLVGDLFYNSYKNNEFLKFRNVYELNDYLKDSPIISSYILIKGSRKIQLEKTIPFL